MFLFELIFGDTKRVLCILGLIFCKFSFIVVTC